MQEEITIEATLKNSLADQLSRMAISHGRPPVEIIADIIEVGLSDMQDDLRLMFEAALVVLSRHKLVLEWSDAFNNRSREHKKRGGSIHSCL